MFIWWGFTLKSNIIKRGLFHCFKCKAQCAYVQKELRRYFALYNIPLIPRDVIDTRIRCTVCRKRYDQNYLAHHEIMRDIKRQEKSARTIFSRIKWRDFLGYVFLIMVTSAYLYNRYASLIIAKPTHTSTDKKAGPLATAVLVLKNMSPQLLKAQISSDCSYGTVTLEHGQEEIIELRHRGTITLRSQDQSVTFDASNNDMIYLTGFNNQGRLICASELREDFYRKRSRTL